MATSAVVMAKASACVRRWFISVDPCCCCRIPTCISAAGAPHPFDSIAHSPQSAPLNEQGSAATSLNNAALKLATTFLVGNDPRLGESAVAMGKGDLQLKLAN